MTRQIPSSPGAPANRPGCPANIDWHALSVPETLTACPIRRGDLQEMCLGNAGAKLHFVMPGRSGMPSQDARFLIQGTKPVGFRGVYSFVGTKGLGLDRP